MAALLLWLTLQSPYTEFLGNEAHFLLSARERAAFDALTARADKDRFIAAFWERWDREQHLERLQACERLFGSGGRHSERGRVYQLLGPPRFRETLAHTGDRLFPVELWHYTGVTSPLLPEAFYLIFFRDGGVGEPRLWNPEIDGVSALVASAEPHRVTSESLAAIDPELALAAESLAASGASRSVLANVRAYEDLLDQERVYGARVRSAVTTRVLSTALDAAVADDDAGVPELHYALDVLPGESGSFAWRRDGARFRVRVTLIGRLLTAAGERERWEDAFEIDVTDRERAKLTETRISFRGRRLVHADDRWVEIALVVEGGGAVASARVAEGGGAVASARVVEHGGGVASGLSSSAQTTPVRVLERDRTPAERARYLLVRGRALLARGELDRALATLREGAAASPDDVRMHVELARGLYRKREYEAVVAHLTHLEARFASEPDLFVLTAASLEALGDDARALDYYERAVLLRPDDAALRDLLETARRRSGRREY